MCENEKLFVKWVHDISAQRTSRNKATARENISQKLISNWKELALPGKSVRNRWVLCMHETGHIEYNNWATALTLYPIGFCKVHRDTKKNVDTLFYDCRGKFTDTQSNDKYSMKSVWQGGGKVSLRCWINKCEICVSAKFERANQSLSWQYIWEWVCVLFYPSIKYRQLVPDHW